MIGSEVDILSRAHHLFSGTAYAVTPDASTTPGGRLPEREARLDPGEVDERYRRVVSSSRAALRSASQADVAAARIIAAAHRDHGLARESTGHVVAEARADAVHTPDTALAQRELLRRRAARLRTQHGHVQAVRRRVQHHRHALRHLRYPTAHRRGLRLPPPNSRAALAVRAALSRLGRPYMWGATGPNRFDCSGLTQWSYAQAGVRLDRTTYQQIHQGIPVPLGYVRPGDLVFPNPGHVQLAIGHNLVVEAPHPGASVRVSPLGTHVQIRRPL